MARRFAKVSEEEIVAINEAAFFYPSDLVNTKTTIPLKLGEERWIYTSTLRVSVYIHYYSPPFRGIVVYYRYRPMLLILTTWLHCSQAEALDRMIEKLKVIYFAKYGFAFPLSGEKFGHLSIPFKSIPQFKNFSIHPSCQ